MSLSHQVLDAAVGALGRAELKLELEGLELVLSDNVAAVAVGGVTADDERTVFDGPSVSESAGSVDRTPSGGTGSVEE